MAAMSTGAKRARFVSQITGPSPAEGASGPTPLSQAGYKRLVPGKGHQLTLLSLEVHADCRYVPITLRKLWYHLPQCTAEPAAIWPDIALAMRLV